MDISNPIRIETRSYRNRNIKVLVFKCVAPECQNEVRVDSGKHRRFTGKCSVCASRKLPFGGVYNTLKLTAKHKGIPLELTYLDYVKVFVGSPCHYCDGIIPWLKYLSRSDYRQNYFLDRKDNTLGYSVENCVPCCTECNYTRGDRYSYEEFLLLRHGLSAIRSLRGAACTPARPT